MCARALTQSAAHCTDDGGPVGLCPRALIQSAAHCADDGDPVGLCCLAIKQPYLFKHTLTLEIMELANSTFSKTHAHHSVTQNCTYVKNLTIRNRNILCSRNNYTCEQKMRLRNLIGI